MERTGTGLAILIGILLLMTAGLLLHLAWRQRAIERLDRIAAGMVCAELGVACFWWPLVRRGEPPMRRWAAVAARIAGAVYAAALGFLAASIILAAGGDFVKFRFWVASMAAAPGLGAIALMVRRPRLLVAWVIGGLAGPGVMLVFLWLLGAGRGSMNVDAVVPVLTLFGSSFPSGMLLGLALAAAFVSPAAAAES